MAAKKVEYQIVGRYMSGKSVVGYHLQSLETGKSGRFTKEQVYYLVGNDQVTNCTGQIYKDDVLLRGKGISLDELPVKYEDGDMKNTEQLGKIKKGTNAADAMEQLMIVKVIKNGRKVEKVVLSNSGGGNTEVTYPELIEMAKAGKIGNARVQQYQGKDILRGVGVNLNELPTEQINNTDSNTVANSGIQTKFSSLVSKAVHKANSLIGNKAVIAVNQNREETEVSNAIDTSGSNRIDVRLLVNNKSVIVRCKTDDPSFIAIAPRGIKVERVEFDENAVASKLAELAQPSTLGANSNEISTKQLNNKDTAIEIGINLPDNLREICKSFKAKMRERLTKMPYDTQFKETADSFKMTYSAGYMELKILNENGDFYIDWEASNGFDGGKVKGNLLEDKDEAIAYIANKAGRIHNLMIH